MNLGSGDWYTMLALTFAVGMKHGLDADHLAAIDGLVRCGASAAFGSRASTPRAPAGWARWCGMSFSAGHGLVVMLMSLWAWSVSWRVPGWIQELGAMISIAVLAVLGLANLRAVFSTPRSQRVPLVGVRAGWGRQLQRNAHPAAPALLGALFAFSFDTLSLASMFALSASRFGSAGRAVALGGSFTLGMVVVDSLNGLWIARLLGRADTTALLASRVMGVAVSITTLLVAGFGVAKILLPRVAAWSEGRELGLGLGVIVVLACAFALAMRLARGAAPAG